MKKIAAILYRTFVDRGIDFPHFRTIGLMGFCLFIHLAEVLLIFNINLRKFIIWNPSASKGSQWVFAALYFGLIWLVLALIFKEHKLKQLPVTNEEIKKGKRILWIYLAANITLLIVLLLRLGIKQGTIKI
ncbi:MAG: hypothetical protein DI535_04210 [Citrobacter freundii]|nr:MAG: hypothetical protein DI535_04210 [Citrobacter freundii]